MTNAHWIYTQTVKTFAAGAEPPFEDPSELMASWGKVWGIDNDVGKIRSWAGISNLTPRLTCP